MCAHYYHLMHADYLIHKYIDSASGIEPQKSLDFIATKFNRIIIDIFYCNTFFLKGILRAQLRRNHVSFVSVLCIFTKARSLS